jgi:altronate dehydratase small subunit
MTAKAIVIHAQDNVANMIGKGDNDQQVTCTVADKNTVTVRLLEDIPSNHKFAFVDIARGEAIIKYGQNIGRASNDIQRGAYVHVHNIESNRGRGDL